ncbi:MAG: radical SAM protein [Ruminococcus sp.]|nr:radical SAM protein [Ruminococcus sp.]MCM1382718.1 radical SAM protein [Muribaculaceae bacterium]MCM1480759.1 radical SAM protein [Muribaculaceae bacterium]
MRYFTLKSRFALRGWSNLKYGILDLESTSVAERVKKLTKRQFDAVELITSGGISPDDEILPDTVRKMTEYAVEKGFFEECNKPKKLEDYQKYNYSKARYTHTLLWSITGNCNLNCRHCYISAGENCCGEPSLEKCYEIIEQCKKANVGTVALTGGEPLVRKDFWEIVDRLLENHIKILQVFTNGIAVNEKFMDEFDKRKINPNYFMVSYDGVGCHDWLRGVKGAEEKAVNAIKLIKSRGYAVYVSTCLHMGNINSTAGTYELMKSLKIDHWKAVPIVNTGNWKNQNCGEINYGKIFDGYIELLKKYAADGMPMDLSLGGFFSGSRAEKKYTVPFASGCGNCERCSRTLCETAFISAYLLPDGRVLPCIAMSGSEIEKIAPNIFDNGQSLEKALSNSPADTYAKYTYKDLFERNAECNSCEKKYICGGCRANALANGGFFEKDPIACQFFKGGYEEKIEKIMREELYCSAN